ncbi:single insulin-like growth factor-binding domain protein-2 [Colossoma macropomum]|uniref:single insulin-like growth factor-binding domain protein-2 n=1 Tax=Colossoma macropomum TaxID=42526 RepID=UPI001864CF40|nr:single insulin-like growth factor-binding domain protein-2 [Colossoma macropomum]
MMCLRRVLISQVVLLLVVESGWTLSCLPCYMVRCPEVLQCAGGKVLEPCICCYECAKQKDEICGGPFDNSGTCDEGLECLRSGRYNEGVCREKTNETTTQRPETTTRDVGKAHRDFIEWLKSRNLRRD